MIGRQCSEPVHRDNDAVGNSVPLCEVNLCAEFKNAESHNYGPIS